MPVPVVTTSPFETSGTSVIMSPKYFRSFAVLIRPRSAGVAISMSTFAWA